MASDIAIRTGSISINQIGPKPPGSRKPASIIGFVSDQQTIDVLRDALSMYARDSIDLRRGDIHTAIETMARTPSPDILIIDIAGVSAPMEVLSSLADVVEPGIRVLVIGDVIDVDQYRQITRGLGISEYIFKPISRETVGRYFGPTIEHSAPLADADRGGRVIAVIGARGGVGATSVAASLSHHISASANRHTALVEADLCRGASVAMMMGAKVGPGLKSAIESPERIDSLFIDRASEVITDRLHLFASEVNFGAPIIRAQNASKSLIDALRLRYNFIIIDVPPVAMEADFSLMDLAHHRVIVFDQTLSGLRDAIRISNIDKGPLQTQRATMVLNRYDQRLSLSAAKINAETNLKIDVTIPDLGFQFTEESNMGRSPINKFKPFKLAIESLAHEIGLSGAGAVTQKPARLGSPFLRLLGRK